MGETIVNVYCSGCPIVVDESDGSGPSIAERLDAIDRSLGTIAEAVEDQVAEARHAHRAEMRRLDEETSELGRKLEAILAGAGSDATLQGFANEIHAISAQLDQVGKPAPVPPVTT